MAAAVERAYEAIRFGNYNRRFHRLIASASGGARLGPMVNQAIEVPLDMDTFRKFTEVELQRSATNNSKPRTLR